MIVPMKKVAVIVQQKDTPGAVEALRSLGALHVEHQQQPAGKDLSLLQDDWTLVNRALEIISEEEIIEKIKSQEEKAPSDWRFTARHIIELWKRLDQLQEYSRSLKQQINDWQHWGDFDPKDIRSLEGNNVYIKLYKIPEKEFSKLSPQNAAVEKIFVKSGIVYCTVIAQEELDFGFKELELPRLSLAEMRKRLSEDAKVRDEINRKLKEYVSYQSSLLKIRKSLEKEIEFQEALKGMARAENLAYLVGFAPARYEVQLINLAKKEKWGILITEPSAQDNVPTLISNPKWVSIINPLFKLLEVLPGYRELDVSLLFLIFFSMFFGMIIADAGYGLIYVLLTVFAQVKFGRKVKEKGAFFLFYTLGFCAIIWGLLTGTFFGQEWHLKAGLKPIIPLLNNTKFLQAFCFFLGALHLSLAHSWKAILKMPSLTALAETGWILLLWAGFFLARMLILGDTFPFFGKWLIIAGITLVVLFSSPQKNIFKAIGQGLATAALSLMNNFTDVVSYIRLFAVGLAGVAIADTVNSLAAGLGSGNLAAKVLIVFIGHTVNFVLGPMSVLVHGVRLNVLEFSGHAGLTWSGRKYKPLCE